MNETQTTTTDLKFEHWCIVELMGHRGIAGKVTEVNLFGNAFMRVDVPELPSGRGGFTKFYGPSAIYALTPVGEDEARAMANIYDVRPVEEWRLRDALPGAKEYPADEREREHLTSLEYGSDDDGLLADDFDDPDFDSSYGN